MDLLLLLQETKTDVEKLFSMDFMYKYGRYFPKLAAIFKKNPFFCFQFKISAVKIMPSSRNYACETIKASLVKLFIF